MYTAVPATCTLHKKVKDIAMRARIAYINYTKKLRIFFNILNFSCVVYVTSSSFWKGLESSIACSLCNYLLLSMPIRKGAR